jgi:hypothetical protein
MISRLYHCSIIEIYKKYVDKSNVYNMLSLSHLNNCFLRYIKNSLLQSVIYNCLLQKFNTVILRYVTFCFIHVYTHI